MFYLGLGDYLLNIERIAVRVKNGGHHIPSEDIIRRHKTSLHNLLNNLNLIDHLIVIDNSHAEGKIVLETNQSDIKYRAEPLPRWVDIIEQKIIGI